MKKLISLFLAFFCLITISACKNGEKKENKYQIAAWEGYDEISFVEFLEKSFFIKAANSGKNITNLNVYYEEGWKESKELDENDLSKNSVPLTYKVEYRWEYYSDMTSYFFMEFDGNKLKVAGSAYTGDGISENDLAETKETLDELVGLMPYAPLYSAVWDKYDKMPLYEVIKKSYSNVSYEFGWDTEELNEAYLSKDVQAVTLVIGGDTYYYLKFEDGEVSVAGSYWRYNQYGGRFEKVEESEKLLNKFIEYVE